MTWGISLETSTIWYKRLGSNDDNVFNGQDTCLYRCILLCIPFNKAREKATKSLQNAFCCVCVIFFLDLAKYGTKIKICNLFFHIIWGYAEVTGFPAKNTKTAITDEPEGIRLSKTFQPSQIRR